MLSDFLLTFVADLLDSGSYRRLYVFSCCYFLSIFVWNVGLHLLLLLVYAVLHTRVVWWVIQGHSKDLHMRGEDSFTTRKSKSMCLHIHSTFAVCTRCSIDKNSVAFQLDARNKWSLNECKVLRLCDVPYCMYIWAIGLPSSTVT